ncbi:hypothetical protein KI387_009596, partial [Taxus chinensis]
VEAGDGVRMSWNVWADRDCVIPTAAVYTPLKTLPSALLLPYGPLRCRSCRSALNPYAGVDFVAKIWVCPLCLTRNHFPPHYTVLAHDNLPLELFPHHTTVEYTAASPSPSPPVFLFVVDTCVREEELGYLKAALTQAISFLANSASATVGFISFGTHVSLHELGFSHIPKSYVFHGAKHVTKDHILDYLNFFVNSNKPQGGIIAGVKDGLSAQSIARFLLPASECEFAFNLVLEELQKDPWAVQSDARAVRCTGTALSLAAGLLGVCVPGSAARIMAFIGGPSTQGSGTIVSKDLSEPIRSHKDLHKVASPYYQKAVTFYEGLAKQLVNQGHVLDVFACALDQVGLAELKVAVERTGGLVVLAESFGHSVFKDSFKRIFESNDHDLGLSFNGIFEVNCSKDVKIHGVIGPCASLDKRGVSCSDTVIGQGNTTAWKLCGLDKGTSLCIFFDVIPKEVSGAAGQSNSNQFFFQFLTYYQHTSGQMRLRITTLSRRWVNGHGSAEELIAGFDQEAAAVIMARLASFKMETEDEFDAIKWLDRSLIHLSSRFGDYQKDDPSSFSLSPRFAIFPQFVYHFRRSQFVQVFNNSPDETAYFRMILNRENVSNSIVMIQPSLISYSFSAPPDQALLDVAAISADRILLLDAYFTVVIFHGTNIAQWRNAGFQNQPEHEAFALLLKAPRHDADAILKEHFPVPRLVVCDQHGSQ